VAVLVELATPWHVLGRQIDRPFGRDPSWEEAVIRARFEIYVAVPARKTETMRPVAEAVAEIITMLPLKNEE